MPGFPIRTSADRCLVDGSPQLFAVTHVLHRFLAPRHPPLALCSLENTLIRSLHTGDTPVDPRPPHARRTTAAGRYVLCVRTFHTRVFPCVNLFRSRSRTNPTREQDARACSAVLKVRRDACGVPANRTRRSGVVEGTTPSKRKRRRLADDDLLARRDRIPATLEVVIDSPASAPTRCVSRCTERTSVVSRESTP